VRLGYVVPEFPSQTHAFFWREIEALRAQGVEVQLISTRRPPAAACRHEFAPAAIRETFYLFPPGARVLRALPGPARVMATRRYFAALTPEKGAAALRRYALLLPALSLAEYARRQRLDHVHVHSCADAAHVAALCHQLGGPSFSLTLHGDLSVYGRDHQIKMQQASFVAAVGSHLLQQVVDQARVPKERVHVSCMGVDLTRLVDLGGDRSVVAGKLHIVTVARLNAMKGHVHALAAVRRAVDAGLDVHYTIAGEGENRATIEARIRALGLERRVTLAGTLSEGEVFALLGRADAFVLPSVGAGEAWPVSVMEAMGGGLPVVSSIIGATPEMITSGTDGILVAQGDESALADALIHLARDVDARRSLGAEGRVTAQRRFDVRVTAGRLADEVRAAVSTASSARSA